MSIDVVVVPTRKKRIEVLRVPADWQLYIELSSPIEEGTVSGSN